MIPELLIFVLVVVVPAPIGYALAWFRPESKSVKNGLIAALPISLGFFGFALWVTLTQDMNDCTELPCENVAPIWAMALYVLGVVTFITGLGAGLLGDAFARKRANPPAE